MSLASDMSVRIRMLLSSFDRYFTFLASPRGLTSCFLLCALTTGLGCAMLTPIGMFPDEAAHNSRADGLRYGQLFGFQPSPPQPNNVNAGVMMSAAINLINASEETIVAEGAKPGPL